MGFFDDLLNLAMKKAGGDPDTCAQMGSKTDGELINMVQNRSGRDKVGAFAELKRRHGTDEANAKVRRGY